MSARLCKAKPISDHGRVVEANFEWLRAARKFRLNTWEKLAKIFTEHLIPITALQIRRDYERVARRRTARRIAKWRATWREKHSEAKDRSSP